MNEITKIIHMFNHTKLEQRLYNRPRLSVVENNIKKNIYIKSESEITESNK